MAVRKPFVGRQYAIVPNSKLFRFAPKSWVAFATADAIHLRGDSITPAMLAHEAVHVSQLKGAGGTWRGLLKWAHLLLNYGYDNHPWEVEARLVERRVQRAPASEQRRLFTPAVIAGH